MIEEDELQRAISLSMQQTEIKKNPENELEEFRKALKAEVRKKYLMNQFLQALLKINSNFEAMHLETKKVDAFEFVQTQGLPKDVQEEVQTHIERLDCVKRTLQQQSTADWKTVKQYLSHLSKSDRQEIKRHYLDLLKYV